MPIADPRTYLACALQIMRTQWPANRLVNIVCHGHSVPAGYFATPVVDTFNAYPHLLHQGLKSRFPFAVLNVIVTAIGGETSDTGAPRFKAEALCHRPDVVTIDYALNDRGLTLDKAKANWRTMIEQAQAADVKVILLTPTSDTTMLPGSTDQRTGLLPQHADQIRDLAAEYQTGLVDSFALFEAHRASADWSDLMSQTNHPNRAGHELVAASLLRWFPAA